MPAAEPGLARNSRRIVQPHLKAVPKGSPPFDVVEAKVLVPGVRQGMLSRTPLVNRLRATTSVPLAIVVAPAGYGKTTLLAQWAERDRRTFAWVSVDERDDDPVVLLRHVAAALDRVEPLGRRVLEALRSPGRSVWASAVPRLASAISGFSSPFVLVLDDADQLRSDDAVEAVRVLAEHVPEGSMLVFTGRVPPRLPIARLRAAGRLLEIGTEELALSQREARIVLLGAKIDLTDAELDDLVNRAEGWAAGLYLAGLAFQQNGSSPTFAEFGGDDQFMAEYLRAEYLSRLTPKHLTFLRRTSILRSMCGALCDAVLERADSSRELAKLETSNLFIVPLDRHGEWFRYHHLFHDLLARELTEREPELVSELHRRAADWFEAQGDLETAFGHAQASGDIARAARILASIALPAYHNGRASTVERWLAAFDDDDLLEQHPDVAVHGSRVHLLRGRSEEAERWLAAAERGLRKQTRGRARNGVAGAIDVVRATLCRDGAEQMLSDADHAVAGLPRTSEWLPSALLNQGAAYVLLDDDELADAAFARSAESAKHFGATATRIIAIIERSLVARKRGDESAADDLSLEARTLVEDGRVDAYATNALELATSASELLRKGRWQQARADLTAAQTLTPLLTHAVPWLAVQTRLELARAYITMRDVQTAKKLMTEVRQILDRRPNLGVLSQRAAQLDDELAGIAGPANGKKTGLTDAELRLLPLLSTHLSFRAIGERLYVSRNTIKTQAISVYRKLGVSSRSDAIEKAAELGLITAPSSESLPAA